MNRRLRLPLLAVVMLLAAAAEGPRTWPAIAATMQRVDWARVADAQRTVAAALARGIDHGAAFLGWSPLAFGLGAGAVVVGLLGGLTLLCWPARRVGRPRRGSRKWSRRDEVSHLARGGNDVAAISQRTRLGQDAIRSLLAAP